MSLFKFGWSHYETQINEAREAYYHDQDVMLGHYSYRNWFLFQEWKKAIDAGRNFVNHEVNAANAPTGKRAALLSGYADFIIMQQDTYDISREVRTQCTGPSCAGYIPYH